MTAQEQQDEMKNRFARVFSGNDGEEVLAFLYQRLHGKDSTLPMSMNPIEMAHNEGKRHVWLMFADMMEIPDLEIVSVRIVVVELHRLGIFQTGVSQCVLAGPR